MKIKLSDTVLNCEIYSAKEIHAYDILLLHGFTGSAFDWNFLIPSLKKEYNVYAMDLIGHGNSDCPDNPELYTIDPTISRTDEFISKFLGRKPVIIGYSMGGRLALSYAVKYPDKINGLILESATWGIKESNLREGRVDSDKKTAEFILSNDIEKFVDYWMNKNIFASQKRLPGEQLKKIKSQKMKNNKTGLANSLLSSGTGSMPPLHDLINKIKVPVLLLTGGLDEKFSQINSEMVKYLDNARHLIIRDAGHNVHLEKPEIYINVIMDFLKNINFS